MAYPATDVRRVQPATATDESHPEPQAPMNIVRPVHPLLAQLERSLALSAAERSAIGELPVRIASVASEDLIHREGDRPTACFLIVEGLVSTSKVTDAGRRQIMSFHVPGDMPDLMGLKLGMLVFDVLAVSDCQLVFVDHGPLRKLCRQHPSLAAYFWRHSLVTGSIFQEWVINVGQRRADSRLAHLFCEMMTKMDAAGLADDGRCDLPLTQAHLSAATGLSLVHVNRTLQGLRKRGLLSFANGALTIHDWDALVQLAEFRPEYLYILAGAPQPA